MSVSTQQDSLIDALRALRGEEQALVAIVEKARASGANEALIREHRKRLNQVRQTLEEKFPEAIDARERCHDLVDSLRPRADAIKTRFDELRARVRLGQLDPDLAKA